MGFFSKTLDPVIALVTIAVLDIFLFVIVGAWTVGGGETMMTGLAAKAVLGDNRANSVLASGLSSNMGILENLH